jgi:hypothetical protein
MLPLTPNLLFPFKFPLRIFRFLSVLCVFSFLFLFSTKESYSQIAEKNPSTILLTNNQESQSNQIVSNLNNLISLYVSDWGHVLSSPLRWNKSSYYKIGGIAAVSGLLYLYDEEILAAFHRSWENPTYSALMKTGEDFEPIGQIEKMNLYCLYGFSIGYAFKMPKLQEASIQIIESLSIASGIKTVFRDVVGRARPSENLGSKHFQSQKGESFPSGHTSNAFQVATIISHHANYWPVTVLSYGLATTVGLWRIDVDLHWASDVFFGAVYGTAVAKSLLAFHDKRKIKLSPKVFPESRLIGFQLKYDF